MRRTIALAVMLGAAIWARDKKLPSGDASNELVDASGVVYDADQLQQTFGSEFGNMFVVVEMTLTPRGDKPLEVHLDDFLLRSDSGNHSGPLAASQIAGQDTLVIHQNGNQSSRKGGFSGGLGPIMMGGGSVAPPPESRTEIKNSDNKDPLLDVLKRKILAEKPIEKPVTGLLFFPLEKEKPRSLELIYTTPAGKIRMKFK